MSTVSAGLRNPKAMMQTTVRLCSVCSGAGNGNGRRIIPRFLTATGRTFSLRHEYRDHDQGLEDTRNDQH